MSILAATSFARVDSTGAPAVVMVRGSLADGTRVELDVPAGSGATLHPPAWHRRKLGRAASAVVSALTGSS